MFNIDWHYKWSYGTIILKIDVNQTILNEDLEQEKCLAGRSYNCYFVQW